jgi:hypothetical protein
MPFSVDGGPTEVPPNLVLLLRRSVYWARPLLVLPRALAEAMGTDGQPPGRPIVARRDCERRNPHGRAAGPASQRRARRCGWWLARASSSVPPHRPGQEQAETPTEASTRARLALRRHALPQCRRELPHPRPRTSPQNAELVSSVREGVELLRAVAEGVGLLARGDDWGDRRGPAVRGYDLGVSGLEPTLRVV